MNEWQPIETAPKDGELFIGLRLSVVVGGKPNWMVEDARWQDGRYRFRSTVRVSPTHWKPFAPPAQ